MQGKGDAEKHKIVQISSNVNQQNTRFIFELPTIYGYDIRTQGFSQPHLQGKSALTGDIFVRPNETFRRKPGQLLKLLKPKYGLNNSGYYWYVTITSSLKNDLKVTSVTGDLAFFVNQTSKRLRVAIFFHAYN